MLRRVSRNPAVVDWWSKLKGHSQNWAELNPWENIKHFRRNPKADILAGITVAIISIPMALAFGVASGLGPETGVWGTGRLWGTDRSKAMRRLGTLGRLFLVRHPRENPVYQGVTGGSEI